MPAHRCLRKASPATLSGPRCCAPSPRPWGSPSCRPKWTVTSTARSRCVRDWEGGVWGSGGDDPSRSPRAPGSLAYVLPAQPWLFPVDTNCNSVFRHRSVSPSSLLDTAISEEVRQGQGLKEEPEAQRPLPGSTVRRHTLAEVSTFSPCIPPCKCPHGQERSLVGGFLVGTTRG